MSLLTLVYSIVSRSTLAGNPEKTRGVTDALAVFPVCQSTAIQRVVKCRHLLIVTSRRCRFKTSLALKKKYAQAYFKFRGEGPYVIAFSMASVEGRLAVRHVPLGSGNEIRETSAPSVLLPWEAIYAEES